MDKRLTVGCGADWRYRGNGKPILVTVLGFLPSGRVRIQESNGNITHAREENLEKIYDPPRAAISASPEQK